MESKRQLQVASQIQRIVGEILQQDARMLLEGAFVTVSGVKVTPDLLTARVFVSVLQPEKTEVVVNNLNANIGSIRRIVGNKMRNKVRRIPELSFLKDASLDEVYKIEALLNDSKPADSDSEE